MEKVKVLCSDCKKETNHNVLVKHEAKGEFAGGDIQWEATYQTIQCGGCDDISFRITSKNSEDYDPHTGRPEEFEQLFPERAQGRAPIDGYEDFPLKTRRVYSETLKALSNGMSLLAAIGLRALIESICLEKKVKGRNLSIKIDALITIGFLSKKQADFLHSHRFMGNVAAHKIEAPKTEHLFGALDIAETLLKTIYILPKTADQIKPTTKKK